MNFRLLARILSIVSLLISGTMAFSLPWAFPVLSGTPEFEWRGFSALVGSIAIAAAAASVLRYFGRESRGQLYRKEAMAVVGLSWILATVLGAMPFLLSRTARDPMVRLQTAADPPEVAGVAQNLLSGDEFAVVWAVRHAGGAGIGEAQLAAESRVPGAAAMLRELARSSDAWSEVLDDSDGRFRLRWVRMNVADAAFESQSGFSTTGATVITELEDPVLVPRCILFWRSSTHFLGGLGIIVLFVAVLGQGSAGKALMRAEMPGPTKEGALARVQHTAWAFTGIYCGLNVALTIALWFEGMTLFDALCHAFGTMATGGFSTYNKSVGHFATMPGVNGELIEYTIVLFMFLAGSNFALLYFALIRKPGRMFADIEWRTYTGVIVAATLLVIAVGSKTGDFSNLRDALRYGLFQVVSIMTTTGYGTHDFNEWNSVGRGLLFLLMFVGGCAGSTGGGLKVIRHILFLKILRLEIEHAFHPTVVRPLRLGGEPVEDQSLRKNVLVYFSLILVIFVFSWMALLTVEPDETWLRGSTSVQHKLIDSASGIAATLNNIGPGLGTVGATQNYAHFTSASKFLFTWLMIVGRLEIFAILVFFFPGFWRDRS
jgi:trk system potassium uptake protein TrkH